MEDPTMFAVYGVISIALFWSLINGVTLGSMVVGGGGVSGDASGDGFSLSVLLRIGVLVFCLLGVGHALGIVDDPFALLRKLVPPT